MQHKRWEEIWVPYLLSQYIISLNNEKNYTLARASIPSFSTSSASSATLCQLGTIVCMRFRAVPRPARVAKFPLRASQRHPSPNCHRRFLPSKQVENLLCCFGAGPGSRTHLPSYSIIRLSSFTAGKVTRTDLTTLRMKGSTPPLPHTSVCSVQEQLFFYLRCYISSVRSWFPMCRPQNRFEAIVIYAVEGGRTFRGPPIMLV